MATYLFSENRELKNIQDGDVVVNDCDLDHHFTNILVDFAVMNGYIVEFKFIITLMAYLTRIQADTEPQTAPNTPVPMGSN